MMKQFNYDLIDEINVNPEENYFFEEIKPFNVCDVASENEKFTGQIKLKHNCNIIGVDVNLFALCRAKKLNYDYSFLLNDFSKDTLNTQKA